MLDNSKAIYFQNFLLLAILTVVLQGCLVGGPCHYKASTALVKVIEITDVNDSDSSLILFQKIDEEQHGTEKTYSYHYLNSNIQELDVKANSTWLVEIERIVSGTCNPIGRISLIQEID